MTVNGNGKVLPLLLAVVIMIITLAIGLNIRIEDNTVMSHVNALAIEELQKRADKMEQKLDKILLEGKK